MGNKKTITEEDMDMLNKEKFNYKTTITAVEKKSKYKAKASFSAIQEKIYQLLFLLKVSVRVS